MQEVAETQVEAPFTEVPAYQRKGMDMATMVNLGWFATGMALLVAETPVKFMLKTELGYTANQVSTFILVGSFPIYVKPLAGILSDAVPLFGTRRRSYLLLAILFSAVFYLALGLVPRQFGWLVGAYFGLSLFQTFTSTVMGGLMVEVGKARNATGRLSAQRLGISKVVGIVALPLAGYLSENPFIFTCLVCASLYLILYPLYLQNLHEPRVSSINTEVLLEMRRQGITLFRSRTLWAAAGLVVLVVAAPGFDTALLYYQEDHLKFDRTYIGWLGAILGLGSVIGAFIYGYACRRMNLRALLGWTIVAHAFMTLWYLLYRTPLSAAIITGVEAATLTLALLPLYDLAARATPRGSEALGYSVMMSVWNFTKHASDKLGSWLYSDFGLSFNQLVWVNAGTTLLVLALVPFLPAALLDHKDGESKEPGLAPAH